MARLVKAIDVDVCIQDMQDGQVAIITQWTNRDYIGRIVQRYNDALITIGGTWGDSFTGLFTGGKRNEDCKVRILPKGTQIEL